MIGDKIREQRRLKGLSQSELAKVLGVSVRSLIRYESGERTPNTELAGALSRALDIPIGELYGENDRFVAAAGELYGVRGHRQARQFIQEAEALFAGGELSEEDKEAFFKAITDIYWESKARNQKRYARKREGGDTE